MDEKFRYDKNNPEDIEVMEQLSLFLKNMAQLMTGKNSHCIHCGKEVRKLTQIGKCVYAEPCGCRQYQGKVPTVWGSEAE